MRQNQENADCSKTKDDNKFLIIPVKVRKKRAYDIPCTFALSALITEISHSENQNPPPCTIH